MNKAAVVWLLVVAVGQRREAWSLDCACTNNNNAILLNYFCKWTNISIAFSIIIIFCVVVPTAVIVVAIIGLLNHLKKPQHYFFNGSLNSHSLFGPVSLSCVGENCPECTLNLQQQQQLTSTTPHNSRWNTLICLCQTLKGFLGWLTKAFGTM